LRDFTPTWDKNQTAAHLDDETIKKDTQKTTAGGKPQFFKPTTAEPITA